MGSKPIPEQYLNQIARTCYSWLPDSPKRSVLVSNQNAMPTIKEQNTNPDPSTMDDLFFKRGHQYWKRNAQGQILLINTQVANHAYDGDAHVFLNPNQFNQDNGTEITEEQFDTVRRAHVARLLEF